MDIPQLFNHLLTEELLDHFQIWSIASEAAIDFGVQVYCVNTGLNHSGINAQDL